MEPVQGSFEIRGDIPWTGETLSRNVYTPLVWQFPTGSDLSGPDAVPGILQLGQDSFTVFRSPGFDLQDNPDKMGREMR